MESTMSANTNTSRVSELTDGELDAVNGGLIVVCGQQVGALTQTIGSASSGAGAGKVTHNEFSIAKYQRRIAKDDAITACDRRDHDDRLCRHPRRTGRHRSKKYLGMGRKAAKPEQVRTEAPLTLALGDVYASFTIWSLRPWLV
jgi:hypothetical protein